MRMAPAEVPSQAETFEKTGSHQTFGHVPRRQLTWHWEVTIFNGRYIFKWLVFQCHVSFPGCNCVFGCECCYRRFVPQTSNLGNRHFSLCCSVGKAQGYSHQSGGSWVMTPMEFLIEAAKVYPSEPVWLVRLDFLGWILFSCWRNPSKNLVTLHMCIYVYIYIYCQQVQFSRCQLCSFAEIGTS